MAFVADNSVIVAWFVPSQANALTREAWLLARKEQVHVPAMWQPEFAAVLHALEKRGLLARHQVDSAVSKVERLGLEVHGALNDVRTSRNDRHVASTPLSSRQPYSDFQGAMPKPSTRTLSRNLSRWSERTTSVLGPARRHRASVSL